MTKRNSLASIVLLALLLAACAPARYRHEATGALTAAEHWSRYLETLDGATLQQGCQPFLRRPPDDVPVRGAIVLYHGFISCPQQYEELAAALARRGYLAVVPLLPGHGRLGVARDRDDTSDLPEGGNWRAAWDELALRMNDLTAAVPGESALVGLSVGSTTALYTALLAPGRYARILLFVPFFGMPGGAPARAVTGLAGRLPFLRELGVGRFGFRERCNAKRAQGRAGYCDYRIKHLIALNRLGTETLRALEREGLAATVQVAALADDAAIDERRLVRAMAAMARNGRSASCRLRDGVTHSVLSPQDNPGIDMFWLEDTIAASVDFILEGTPFPVEERSADEPPWALCSM